ncbi:hypothetical protein CR205_08430 [Alteribacter lacisalsi]|uniref:Uncharacterized protein n=1 Tax=Alteribacter lacisalsi TaxID=2045244 RepID=A0A2W0H9R3_9BACI|nr:hypothetical protein [Alteribacter lacisalsi]PYZ98594.1 hypothetical protein CR205_08430 [Alteribacter lacisalsi]
MTSFNDSLYYFTADFIPSAQIDLIFLIIIALIFWTWNKTTGFQLLFLLSLSVSIAHIIQLFLPAIYVGQEQLPLTHTTVQAVTTFFAFFIPLAKNRLELAAVLGPVMAVSVTFLLFTGVPVFSLVGAIIIGGFIVYGFYRSFDWIGAMPDRYVMAFAIVLPAFLAGIIYPHTAYLLHAGYLLGAGIGVSLEFVKVRMNVSAAGFSKRLPAAAAGLAGIAALNIFAPFLFSPLPLPLLAQGIATGLWITIVLPILLVSLKIYEQEGKGKIISSS